MRTLRKEATAVMNSMAVCFSTFPHIVSSG